MNSELESVDIMFDDIPTLSHGGCSSPRAKGFSTFDEQIETILRESRPLEAYYDVATGKYLVRNEHQWIEQSAAQIKRRLKIAGHSARTPEGSFASQADIKILEYEDHFSVNYAGELAGYVEGFFEERGFRFLVTKGPTLIEPRIGEWNTLKATFEAVLHDEEHNQLDYFYGWLRYAVESLHAGRFTAGQALVLAGAAGSGKSLTQNLITEMLGGRSAKPYQFMTGKTGFNSDMFKAEHLMIEDESPSVDIKSRRALGTYLKQVTVNEDQRLHAKNRDAIMVKPFWRLSITLNDEPEDLLVLPPIDDGLQDKLILLKAYKREFPMETDSGEKRDRFRKTLSEEIPAFLYWLLNEFSILENLKSQRFGVVHFQHPVLIESLQGTTPEARLLELIDQYIDLPFKGTASELEGRLRGRDQSQTKSLLYFSGACGTYLGRLSKFHKLRIFSRKTNKRREWEIFADDSCKKVCPDDLL